MERLVKIDAEGNLTFLYDDKMPWEDLGTMTCERASDVVFDPVLQMWCIAFPDGRLVGAWKSREAAIQGEIHLLEKDMEAGKIV
jgi:hypothetical protein